MKLNLQTGKKVRIEMLPLIDIVFLLLVFFIYAMLSMAVHRGLPIDLPSSATVQVDKELILSVTIKADGSVFVDDHPVPLENLTGLLKAKSSGHPKQGVLLFADRTLSYQNLFSVLDKIKLAGIENVSLQAEADQP